jgi:hypothetical protein
MPMAESPTTFGVGSCDLNARELVPIAKITRPASRLSPPRSLVPKGLRTG